VKRDHVRQAVATLLFMGVVTVGMWSVHGELIGVLLILAALGLFLEMSGTKLSDLMHEVFRRLRDR